MTKRSGAFNLMETFLSLSIGNPVQTTSATARDNSAYEARPRNGNSNKHLLTWADPGKIITDYSRVTPHKLLSLERCY